MFRNQYDSDVTVWSPQGRLHQVEYAMEAVKQGSATVGLKNKTHAVLIALKRAASELAAHQKKIIVIDEHMGLSFAGLTADARILGRYMRMECLNYKYAHKDTLPVFRLISTVGNKMQVCTQRYDKRPYGVGLLVAGYDDNGPHIYQTCPSSNYYDVKAMAIGSRSQSARTYLEKRLTDFPDSSLEEIVKHGLRALRDTLPNDSELTTKNVSIALVGKDTKFKSLDERETGHYLSLIEGEERRGAGGAPPAGGPDDGPAPPGAPSDPAPTVAMDTTD
uniref:Proteasome subunit alpha type n=1 Tax=Cacopsylla melanoneura TaxID=428564 RepID=A0A8D8UWT8_9HEMI